MKPAPFLGVFPTEWLAFEVGIALIDRAALGLVLEHILVRVELLAIAFADKFIAPAERTICGIYRFARVVRVGSHEFFIKY